MIRYFFVFVLFIVSSIDFAQAQAVRGKCNAYEQEHTPACTSGKDRVWHYAFKNLKTGDREWTRSLGYASQSEAQKATNSARKLCEIVARYWDKTSCQTEYMAPFCSACGPFNDLTKLPKTRSDMKAAIERQLDVWNGMIGDTLEEVQTAIRTGQSNSSPRFGNNLREYVGEIRAVQERVRSLENTLQNMIYTNVTNINNELDEFMKATAKLQTSHKKLIKVQQDDGKFDCRLCRECEQRAYEEYQECLKEAGRALNRCDSHYRYDFLPKCDVYCKIEGERACPDR